MDSLLIFAALFSASVTAFVIEIYKTLSQDAGEVTISVLLQISQQLANSTHAPVAVRPPFKTDPRYVSVNIFLFLSLAFSLTCALAAVLVRQWARQYLRFPRSFSSTSERARARQYVFENMQWWKMEVIVEMIPILLHISLLLFFIGLLLFLHIINNEVALFTFCFTATGTVVYMWLTIAPLIFPGCPYKTPFSGFLSSCLPLSFVSRSFQAMLKFAAVTLACIIVWLSMPLSAVIQLWLPSFKIPQLKRARELYSPIRTVFHSTLKVAAVILACIIIWLSIALSAVIQLWLPSFQIPQSTPLRELYSPVRRVLHTVFRRGSNSPQIILRSWQTSQAFARLLRISVHNTTSHIFRTALDIYAERRRTFCNELTTRDTRALSWVMDYSKRDIDMFTMITAVPDFVQSNEPACVAHNVHSVMRNCGIASHTIPLLRSTTFATNRALSISLLETTIWLTRCSTYRLADGVGLDTRILMEIASIFCQEINTGNNSDLAKLYGLALSNIVFHLLYRLEKDSELAGNGNLRSIDLPVSTNDVAYALVDLVHYIIHKISEHPMHGEIDKLSSTLDRFIWRLSNEGVDPISARDTRHTLRVFRSEWATNMLGSQLPFADMSPLHQKLALPSMSDMTTHLQNFPHSSCDSQVAIFTLLNDILANSEHKGKLRPTENDLSMVFSAYGFVLFGPQFELDEQSRRTLHTDFMDRVKVSGAESIDGHNHHRVDVTVDVPFSWYCTILNETLFSLKEVFSGNSESVLPLSDEWIWNLLAETIRKLLKKRIHEINEGCDNPIAVDATHLADARELQAIIRNRDIEILNGISFLITKTARQFGYELLLKPTYHINTHAELQYYDMIADGAIFS